MDARIQFVKDAYDHLYTITDEEFVDTNYWQYLLDNGGTKFQAGVALYIFDSVDRTLAIAIMRQVLIVLYQLAWVEEFIPQSQ